MQIATNDSSMIHISVEELQTLINRTVEEKLEETLTQKEPKKINTDAWIYNGCTTTSAYAETTSMTGLTRTTDPNNNIAQYLSYSSQDGYTVLKGRMVFYFYEINCSKFRTFSRSYKCILYKWKKDNRSIFLDEYEWYSRYR